MLRPLMIVLAGLCALVSPSCGGETAGQSADPAVPGVVTVEAGEMHFEPPVIRLSVGHQVTLRVRNTGGLFHDLSSSLPIGNLQYATSDNPAGQQSMNVAASHLDVDVAAGHTAQVTFVPTSIGTYTFVCDIPGHTEAGMTGNFSVG